MDLFRYVAGWATKIEGNTTPISVLYTPGTQYLAYTSASRWMWWLTSSPGTFRY